MAKVKAPSRRASSAPEERKTFVLPVELTEEEDGRWSAEVPLLPGCATWGESWQEALRHAKEAAEGYIAVLLEDGRAVPSPRDLPRGPLIIAEV